MSTIRLFANHLLVLAVGTLLMFSIRNDLRRNNVALHIIRQIEVAPGCTVAAGGLIWRGGTIPAHTTPLFQAVAYAANAPNSAMPELEEWDHDLRLFYGFSGQGLIVRQHLGESLSAFRQAQISLALLSVGHYYHAGGEYSCALLNWELAHEIAQLEPEADPNRDRLDNYRFHLYNSQQTTSVISTFQYLLRFNQNKPEWRLHLGEALIQAGAHQQAEEVLRPLLASSYRNQVEALLAQP